MNPDLGTKKKSLSRPKNDLTKKKEKGKKKKILEHKHVENLKVIYPSGAHGQKPWT